MTEINMTNKTGISLFLAAFVMLIMHMGAVAQPFEKDTTDNKRPAWKENLFFGGNLGASFGATTYLHVSPVVGFRFSDKFSVGLRGSYQYFKSRNWEFSIYGGGIFSRYVVFRNIYAHVEYQPLNVQKLTSDHERMWIHGVLAGGGYRQPLGSNGYAHIEILYDLNETIYTPYDNPMIRIGFTF